MLPAWLKLSVEKPLCGASLRGLRPHWETIYLENHPGGYYMVVSFMELYLAVIKLASITDSHRCNARICPGAL